MFSRPRSALRFESLHIDRPQQSSRPRAAHLATCRCRYNSSSAPPSSAAGQAEKVAEDVLPFLQRPLGVNDPPTTLSKTWRERTQELMNQDVRMEQRRHLVKEAVKGYYSDFNALKRFGGKTWVAPPSLIREEQALYFPNVSGTALDSNQTVHTTDLCKDKVSVIAMLSTKVSEEHVDTFVSRTNEAYLEDDRYQFVQVNLQENVLKAYLVSFYISSLRKTIPPPLRRTYLLSTQNMEYLRKPLEMNNKHIGFVYLVDQNLKVRWAGGGMAREEESESLRNCVRVLLNRFSKDRTL